MNKKVVTRIFCVVLAVILALMLVIPAVNAASYNLVIDVLGIEDYGDEKIIYMEIENNASTVVSFGWVNSCQFIVTTSEGRYSFEPPYWDKVQPGHNEYTLEYDCPGTIEKIEITDLRLLDSRGLPGKEIHNAVIYNAAKGISQYRGNFKSNSVQSMQSVMFVIVPVIMVAIVVLFIILAVRQRKKNKQAMNTFNPFGGNGNPDMHQQMHNQAMDMHNQAMDMHNQAHQQAVNHINNQQFQQFTHQSSTTMDMGGFNPPPPPPPTGF